MQEQVADTAQERHFDQSLWYYPSSGRVLESAVLLCFRSQYITEMIHIQGTCSSDKISQNAYWPTARPQESRKMPSELTPLYLFFTQTLWKYLIHPETFFSAIILELCVQNKTYYFHPDSLVHQLCKPGIILQLDMKTNSIINNIFRFSSSYEI